MKTMKFTNRFFGLLFAASLLMACSKDGNDGAIGPQGAKGEQGPAGPQGEDGGDGVDGETGTANVIYSPWIESGFQTPIASQNGSFSIAASEITQEIIDTGVIMVFGKDDSDVIYALPLTLHNTTTDESYFFTFENPGSLEIGVSEINGNNLGNIFINNEFRYVIIPGGNPTSGKSSPLTGSPKMAYEEIALLFDIQD